MFRVWLPVLFIKWLPVLFAFGFRKRYRQSLAFIHGKRLTQRFHHCLPLSILLRYGKRQRLSFPLRLHQWHPLRLLFYQRDIVAFAIWLTLLVGLSQRVPNGVAMHHGKFIPFRLPVSFGKRQWQHFCEHFAMRLLFWVAPRLWLPLWLPLHHAIRVGRAVCKRDALPFRIGFQQRLPNGLRHRNRVPFAFGHRLHLGVAQRIGLPVRHLLRLVVGHAVPFHHTHYFWKWHRLNQPLPLVQRKRKRLRHCQRFPQRVRVAFRLRLRFGHALRRSLALCKRLGMCFGFPLELGFHVPQSLPIRIRLSLALYQHNALP